MANETENTTRIQVLGFGQAHKYVMVVSRICGLFLIDIIPYTTYNNSPYLRTFD